MNKPTLGLFPCKLISEYSKPYQWWRKQSTPSAEAIFASRWIQDFWHDAGRYYHHEPRIGLSLLNWLRQRLILGPPRPRGHWELADMDEDYLTQPEFHTHYVPWMKTWPPLHDLRWCIGPHHTTLPHWVIHEYIHPSPNFQI